MKATPIKAVYNEYNYNGANFKLVNIFRKILIIFTFYLLANKKEESIILLKYCALLFIECLFISYIIQVILIRFIH